MADDFTRVTAMDRWRRKLEMIALVLTILVCAAVLGLAARALLLPPVPVEPATTHAQTPPPPPLPPPPQPLPAEPIGITGAPIKGDPNAPVAIIGYSDFQCPYCVRFATTTLAELERAYLDTGRALYVFKHLPITSLHPQAVRMAEASECAGGQGKFWPMHDRLFAAPRQADARTLQAHAEALGLERPAFETCLDRQKSERVQVDAEEANRFGVTGTPTFFIGVVESGGVRVVERLVGALPVARFASAIERAVERAETGDR